MEILHIGTVLVGMRHFRHTQSYGLKINTDETKALAGESKSNRSIGLNICGHCYRKTKGHPRLGFIAGSIRPVRQLPPHSSGGK